MTSRKRRKAATNPVQIHRERLFGALGIIAVTREACQTLEDPISMMDALRVVYDVVNDVAGALERFTSEDEKAATSLEDPAHDR